MKKLLVLLMCLLPLAAHAQKTKTALTTEVNTNLASGTAITASTLRATIIDIINSYVDANGGSSLPCATSNWISAIATLSSVTCSQPNITDLVGFGTGVQNALTSNLNVAGGIVSPAPANAGDLIYWNGTAWTLFPANNSGTQVLSENASGIPAWATVAGTGTVTSVTCGTGLSGGTFTTSGTCAVASHVLLNTLTASTSATLSDTSSFTGTYSVYELEFINLVNATATVSAEIQVHSSGVFQTSGYQTTGYAPNGTATTSITPTTFIPLSFATLATSGTAVSGISGSIRVYAPSTAAKHPWMGLFMYPNSAGAGIIPFTTAGMWNTAGAIDGFQFLFSSGTITSGTINIYGIK